MAIATISFVHPKIVTLPFRSAVVFHGPARGNRGRDRSVTRKNRKEGSNMTGGLFAPKKAGVSFKRNNSSYVTGKPPENPEIASMMGKLPKRDAGSTKKPK